MTTEPTDKQKQEARQLAEEITRFIHSTTSFKVTGSMTNAFETIIAATEQYEAGTRSKWQQRKTARALLWDWKGAEHLSMPLLDELVDRVASALAARDVEVRAVLEGLSSLPHIPNGESQRCWCTGDRNYQLTHSPACLATQRLWNKVQPVKEGETQVL